MKSFSELTSASYVSNSDILAISQENSGTYSSKKTTVKEVSDFANQNIAEEYDSTSSYAVGDYCIYESVLYKCIGTTTGTFDSTKWTSVVVTDEMGQGGGGTGGHTIIDENGNSMTARAGLQFVGANVSDDSTNNKTIVDVASAGGIDGVFVDTSNVIVQPTSYTPSSFSYTATQDCALYIEIPCKGGFSTFLQIDGVNTQGFNVAGSNTTNYGIVTALLKKGQVATLSATEFPSVTPDYAVYGIQTGTTHSKFQPVIYSTEEREIGVWTDGKPLYEKTFYKNNLATTFSDFVKFADMDNPETFVSIKWSAIRDLSTVGGSGILKYTGNGASYTEAQNTNYYILMRGSGNELQYRLGNNYGITEMWATVQYTKTTDTAGSGSWTPQGVPTHHYSTDEQVIGTWIDGKTLYEKTWDLGSDITVGNWTTIMTLSGIDKLISSESVQTDASISYIEYWIDGTTLKGNSLRNSNPNTDYVRYLTLRYTKSS